LKKTISSLKNDLLNKDKKPINPQLEEFEKYLASGKLDSFINYRHEVLTKNKFNPDKVSGSDVAKAFGLVEQDGAGLVKVSKKGRDFLSGYS